MKVVVGGFAATERGKDKKDKKDKRWKIRKKKMKEWKENKHDVVCHHQNIIVYRRAEQCQCVLKTSQLVSLRGQLLMLLLCIRDISRQEAPLVSATAYTIRLLCRLSLSLSVSLCVSVCVSVYN